MKKTSNKKIVEEDIYLTKDFKPFSSLKTSSKVKKIVVKPLIIIIILALIIGGLGYFFVYPIYKTYVNSEPDKVLYKTFESIDNNLEDVIGFLKNKNVIEFELKTDDYKIDNSYKYFINFKNNEIILKDKSRNIFNLALNNGYYNVNDNILDISKLSYDSYDDYLEFLKGINAVNGFIDSDVDNILNVLKKSITNSLKDKNITSGDEVITIDGEDLSVKRNTLEIDSSDLKTLKKSALEKILNNDDYLNSLAILYSSSKKDVSNYLEKILNSEIGKIKVNVYTIQGVKVVGFDIEENGFRRFYVYSNGNKFEIYLNINLCLSYECEFRKDNIFKVEGKKDSNNTEGEIFYNNKDVGKYLLEEDSFDLNLEFSSYKISLFMGNNNDIDFELNLIRDKSVKFIGKIKNLTGESLKQNYSDYKVDIYSYKKYRRFLNYDEKNYFNSYKEFLKDFLNYSRN